MGHIAFGVCCRRPSSKHTPPQTLSADVCVLRLGFWGKRQNSEKVGKRAQDSVKSLPGKMRQVLLLPRCCRRGRFLFV